MCEQDKYEIQYFLQRHGHIMYHMTQKHDTKVMEQHFPFLPHHKNYNLFKTI